MWNQQQSSGYDAFSSKPANYTQSLWKVQDTELYKPGERFIRDTSPYVDAIAEGVVAGPLEGAPLPKGLLSFMEDLCNKIGVAPLKHSTTKDVADYVMSFLDFTEPYYLLVEAPVQLNSNQIQYVYRLKSNRSVLNPKQLECFSVVNGYDFPIHRKARDLLSHPNTQAVLAGKQVRHPTRGDFVLKRDITEKLGALVLGNYDHILSWVDEWLMSHYDSLKYDHKLTDTELLELDSVRDLDLNFWIVATIGALLWFKTPFALKFLIEYHPIYASVLAWNHERNSPVIAPNSGGEAIVFGYEVHTRETLIVEEGTPPGTCESCKQSLHCTKHLNAQALFHPLCSCGKLVPVEDTNFDGHVSPTYDANGWRRGECDPYMKAHAPFNAFVCMRCVEMVVDQRDPKVAKCSRMECPATQCPHHAGRASYVHELTKRRALLLTQRTNH